MKSKEAKGLGKITLLAGWLLAPGANAGVNFTNLTTSVGQNVTMLVQAGDGSLYGTVPFGGGTGYGEVVKLAPDGTLTSWDPFGPYGMGSPSPNPDGANPAWLVPAPDGTLYGTTLAGGTNVAFGTFFQITTNGVVTPLSAFTGTNGINSYGFCQGPDGNFYGTTFFGGPGFNFNQSSTNFNYGTVYRFETNGTISTLVAFNITNGSYPSGPLLLGADGSLYGATDNGGSDTNLNINSLFQKEPGSGTIFKITTNGMFTSLVSFTPASGGGGIRALLQARDGNLYGVTYYGGACNAGTVFRVTTDGQLSTLYSFQGTNGGYPLSLVQAQDGSLYGVGRAVTIPVTASNPPYGLIFKVTLAGEFSVCYSFAQSAGLFANSLIAGFDGNFYGSAYGNIFRLSLPLAPIVHTTLSAAGSLGLSWSAAAGQMYQVQWSSDPQSGNWTNLGDPTTATTGSLSYSASVEFVGQRFYRVVVLP